MMNSFKNTTVLVTGASSGIGKALARELAAQGAHMILVSRNVQRLEQIAEDLKSRFGVNVHIFPEDLERLEDRLELFAWVQKSGITVDVLINNAGVGHYGPFNVSSAEEVRSMLDLNVQALTHLTQLFLPGMLKRGTGGILNVASTAGFQPLPYLSVYSATKAYVLNFSEALWAECKKSGVRIFCVCPGNTLTYFDRTAGIPRQKLFFSASAREVARFALKKFLRSSRPSAIYGYWNKLMTYSERLIPRRAVLWVTRMIYQPPRHSSR